VRWFSEIGAQRLVPDPEKSLNPEKLNSMRLGNIELASLFGPLIFPPGDVRVVTVRRLQRFLACAKSQKQEFRYLDRRIP
jgi:hypothetical protein